MSDPSTEPSADPPFDRVGVLGLGVVGGSLARGLSRVGVEVRGWTPDERDARDATESGVLAAPVTSLEAALHDVDLVVLAAPLGASVDLLDVVSRRAPEGATVTDVVSLKQPMAVAARKAGLQGRWVGSHPMAGSEASGFAASVGELFADAAVWIVSIGADDGRVDALHRFWESLGARPIAIAPDEHDRVMALVSHLPQLAANAVAWVLAEAGVEARQLGPGGRDVTRLAGSSPVMWADLLAAAPPELALSLRAAGGRLTAFAESLEKGDVEALLLAMEQTRAWRGGS